jgi:hypothetical protein
LAQRKCAFGERLKDEKARAVGTRERCDQRLGGVATVAGKSGGTTDTDERGHQPASCSGL